MAVACGYSTRLSFPLCNRNSTLPTTDGQQSASSGPWVSVFSWMAPPSIETPSTALPVPPTGLVLANFNAPSPCRRNAARNCVEVFCAPS